jgi:hypothetical protein
MYELMKEILSEEHWTTKNHILVKLKYLGLLMDERQFRKLVERFNNKYQDHETDGYTVIHSSRGYKLTKDYDEMRESDKDLYKRAMNMLKRVARNKKVRGEDLHLYSLQLFVDTEKTMED